MIFFPLFNGLAWIFGGTNWISVFCSASHHPMVQRVELRMNDVILYVAVKGANELACDFLRARAMFLATGHEWEDSGRSGACRTSSGHKPSLVSMWCVRNDCMPSASSFTQNRTSGHLRTSKHSSIVNHCLFKTLLKNMFKSAGSCYIPKVSLTIHS